MVERRRAADLVGHVLTSQPPPRARLAIGVASFVCILLIGVLDYGTGPNLSFGVFYLLPVAAGAIGAGTRAGLGLAAESATVWVLAEALIRGSRRGLAVNVANGVLRFLIILVVVGLLVRLREALDAARASDQRSRDFLASAAHQLRTPVAGVRASTETLIAEGGRPSDEPLLLHIAGETARLGRLVSSLLRVARLDHGEVPDRRPCDVIELCTAEAARISAQAPHVRVDVTAGEDVPPALLLSAEAVREIVGNLLDNARRHANREITVRLGASGSALAVSVCDDGPGLPAGTEQRAFDRFVSMDGRGGSGLGLAIARGLAEQEGGELRYQSGSFVLSLPLVVAERSSTPHRQSARSSGGGRR